MFFNNNLAGHGWPAPKHRRGGQSLSLNVLRVGDAALARCAEPVFSG